MKAPSQWSEWYGVTCKKSGKISSTKKKKQQRKFLIYIQKLLKINISFITSNHFSRLCPFVFVKPRSKHKYQCFPILVQSFSACTFQESMRWLFPIQTFISLVMHFPFKWPRQEAKTKQQQNNTTPTATRSRECSPTNRRKPTKLFLARCHMDFALIG